MKKLLLVLVALMMVVSGCGKKGQAPQETQQEQGTQQENGENPAVQENGGAQETHEAATAITENVEPVIDEPIITEDVQEGDYTSQFIAKFLDSGAYYLKVNVSENGKVGEYEIAVNGDKSAIKDGQGVKIVDAGTLYFVLNDSNFVIKQEMADKLFENSTNFIFERQLSGDKEKLVSSGKEEINGQEFFCEEFKNEDVTVKYYYDDKTIRYVKTIDALGNEKHTQVLELTHNVPESLFVIPEDYIVQDLSEIQEAQ